MQNIIWWNVNCLYSNGYNKMNQTTYYIFSLSILQMTNNTKNKTLETQMYILLQLQIKFIKTFVIETLDSI